MYTGVSYIALEHFERRFTASDATEAFGFAVRLFDTFTRLLRNLKITLLGMNKTFKRSELKAYHDGHTLALRDFFKTRTLDYTRLVPIPSGMKVSYADAVSTLDGLYQTLSIDTTISTLLHDFQQMGTAPKDPRTTTKEINRLSKAQVETTLRRLFSTEKTLDVPLGSVIASFETLVRLDQEILGYDAIFQHVPTICADIDKIEIAIDQVVTSLEKQSTIDKAYIAALYQLVRTASVQLDLFGVILAELQRVEHNFVVLLKSLVADAQKA
jgi:hypothetical protein